MMKPNGYVILMLIEQQQAAVRKLSDQEQILREAGIIEPSYLRMWRWLRKGWNRPTPHQAQTFGWIVEQ